MDYCKQRTWSAGTRTDNCSLQHSLGREYVVDLKDL